MSDYGAFLQAKAVSDPATGLSSIPALNPALFDFQRDIVSWALRRGRAAVFADCGLGKSPIELVWAHHVPGRVQSCADGSMRVAIKYRKGSIHGVLTRLAIAAHIGDLINGSLK